MSRKPTAVIACECGKLWNGTIAQAIGDGWKPSRDGFECEDCASGRFKYDATLNCRPTKGLWLVHPKKGRVYGQITEVRRNGTVVWKGSYGQPVTTRPSTLIDGGYQYAEEPCSQ